MLHHRIGVLDPAEFDEYRGEQPMRGVANAATGDGTLRERQRVAVAAGAQ